jgi:hypothetical protein
LAQKKNVGTSEQHVAAYAPLTQAYTLLNGRPVQFVMPDMFAFASGSIDIPNDVQAAIYRLIYRGAESVADAQQLIYDQRWTRSMYYVAQLCIAPRVRLEADEEGEIDVRELMLDDLLACFSFFRYGPPPALPAAADQNAGQGAGIDRTDEALPE